MIMQFVARGSNMVRRSSPRRLVSTTRPVPASTKLSVPSHRLHAS